MTLDEYKENYIKKSNKKEKCVYVSTPNYFKREEKIIRNLSPISYRLLNYILYTYLFYANIITEKKNLNYFYQQREIRE